MGDYNDLFSKQILDCLRKIRDPIAMLHREDQRVGGKLFYSDKRFKDIIGDYYSVLLDCLHSPIDQRVVGIDERVTGPLIQVSGQFIDYVQSRFSKDRSRILTALRKNAGASFSNLYKTTVRMRELLVASALDRADDSDVSLTLPEQHSSLIYTKVENGRVTLDSGHPLHPFLRKESVDETRRYLRGEIISLDKNLRKSNVDPKYIEAFARLIELIEFKDDAGAISFGLHIRMISQLSKALEAELSDILNIQISSTLTHSSYFASQYKDWLDFVRNAQGYPARASVDEQIDKSLSDVNKVLKGNPKVIDERIPQSIQFLQTMLNGSKNDRLNASYAGVRSIENICISAISYSHEQAKQLLIDSISKSRKPLATIGAGLIIVVAIEIISNFMPIIKSAPELSWILENLAKITKLSKILS